MNTVEETTGRSVASRLKHQFIYALIRIGGREVAYVFLIPLVLVYCLKRNIRNKSRAYIERRFAPKNKWEFFKHTFLLNLTFGRTLVDRATFGILGKSHFLYDKSIQKQYANLAAKGKGLLLLTAHVGCWQSAIYFLQFLKKPLHVLYYHNPKDNDKTVAEHRGKKAPFTIINPATPLGGIPEMLSALQRGEIVCAMADRVFGNPKNTVRVQFLGGTVLVPYSFYRLAAVTRSPIIQAFFPWQKSGQFSAWAYPAVYIDDLGPTKANYQMYAQKFIDELAQFCIKYPYQFFNYFDWWESYDTTNNR